MNRRLVFQITSFSLLILLLITALPTPVHSAPPIDQGTLIVDINGNGDFVSIKDAIEFAQQTSIIQVKAGTYAESNVGVYKKLSIIGDSPENTIIDFNGGRGINLSSSNVEIHNLKLINAHEYAIFVQPGSDRCIISNCIIENYGPGNGISTEAFYTTFSNCKIYGNGKSASGISVRKEGNIITNCNVSGFDVGAMFLVDAHNNKLLSSNLYNNINGIDIRIDSNQNLVSNCNVYGNELGIKIWQSSLNNSVYLNNFWKNTKNAVSEDKNIWDNNVRGNYWEDYQGVDNDNNGIGDTSYKVSDNNFDRYPLLSRVLPDKISAPNDVKRTSVISDTNPSFSWSAPVYSKTIEGYYVKIDNTPEIFIGDTTTWTSSRSLTEGVHTFYIRSFGTDNTTSEYATVTFWIDTSFKDSDGDGWSDAEEQQYGTDPYDPNNYPLDTDGDHIPDSVDPDIDNDGYSNDMELSYGTDPRDKNSHPLDTDGDGIPDNDSTDGKYMGDTDDDNDGVPDTVETQIGSNPKNASDAKKIYIAGKAYYIIDIGDNGIYDVLYDPKEDTISNVEREGENYLIDQDGDGDWDHIYNTSDETVSVYGKEQPLSIPIVWILIIVTILAIALFIFYYTRQKRYVKRDEIPERFIEEPAIRARKPEKITAKYVPDKKQAVDETITLLKLMREEIKVYMDRLQDMDQRVVLTSEKEKKKPLKREKFEVRDVEDIEFVIDNFLFGRDEDSEDGEDVSKEKKDEGKSEVTPEVAEKQVASTPTKEEKKEPVKSSKFEVITVEDIEFGIDNSLFGMDENLEVDEGASREKSETKPEVVEKQVVSTPEKEKKLSKSGKFEVRDVEDIEFGIDNSLFGKDEDSKDDKDSSKEKKNKEKSEKK